MEKENKDFIPGAQEAIGEARHSYTYRYSAAQQEEMAEIARKYIPRRQVMEGQDRLARLRQIDARVENTGTIVGMCLGVTGLLLLGIGMCCVLVWMGIWFVIGIPVGVLGIGFMITAYPACHLVTNRMREKYSEEVMQLTENEKFQK